ncbi:hypothetical protein DXG03_003522 [Asterophora parasitica]|uniref:Uncharacterized protein n=1 Tax=Asterophora parasitica TaxID=117018 RepID=A0A9P7G9F0_9AGAR|nr:hypothetical protein DXG03_003522 [Asterophora parasitica]
MRTFRVALWLHKIVFMPIAATISALYDLLFYLFKNAQLFLEAQRNRAESDAPEEDLKSLESQVSFSTLPRALTSGVELLAAIKDGKVVASVGLDNEIIIWRVDKKAHLAIDAGQVLLRTATIATAVGTGSGIIAVWTLEGESAQSLPLFSLDNLSAAVTDIQFATAPVTGLALLATYENGVAAKWPLERGLTAAYFASSRQVPIVKCSLVRIHPMDRFFVAFSLQDGTLEILDTRDVDPLLLNDFCVQAGDATNTASRVHAWQTELGGALA